MIYEQHKERKIVREIKFQFLYKGLPFSGDKNNCNWHKKIYSLEDFEKKSLSQLSDVHCQSDLIAKRQYTGLKDKNGLEVYEGDIVSYSTPIESGVAEIKDIFGTCNMAFHWISQKTTSPSMFSEVNYFMCQKEIEIIGNIYQNPELIGEK